MSVANASCKPRASLEVDLLPCDINGLAERLCSLDRSPVASVSISYTPGSRSRKSVKYARQNWQLHNGSLIAAAMLFGEALSKAAAGAHAAQHAVMVAGRQAP